MARARVRSQNPDDLAAQTDLASFVSWQPVTAWLIPSSVELCVLDGAAALAIGYADGSTHARDATSARHALDRLRRLDGASDVRFRAFVQAYGSLFRPDDAMGVGYPAVFFQSEGGREAIGPYREIAKLLAATLRLVARIRRRGSVTASDLRIVHDWLATNELGTDYTVKVGAAICARVLAGARGERVAFHVSLRGVPVGVVNWWLRAQAIRPLLTWREGDRPLVRWTGGLWGVIGAQLIFAVRAGERMIECQGCGGEVQRKRQPKTGQSSWCDDIDCARIRDRAAKRRSRARAELRVSTPARLRARP